MKSNFTISSRAKNASYRPTVSIKTKCFNCGRLGGLIRKYKLDICRLCFKENHKDLGFTTL